MFLLLFPELPKHNTFGIDEIGPALKGIVEVDETYVGGKPRKRKGRSTSTVRGLKKQVVLMMAQRKGQMCIAPIETDGFDVIALLLRQLSRTLNYGIRPLIYKTYHWPTGIENTL